MRSEETQPRKEAESTFDLSSAHTDNFPKILTGLNISLAITEYYANRFIFLRSNGTSINTHYIAFPRPMGLWADREHLTFGTWSQVLDFRKNSTILQQLQSGKWENEDHFSRKIAFTQQEKEEQAQWETDRKAELEAYQLADSLYIPRAAHVTGMINIHDIAWGDEGLWVVNSTFSSLCTLDSNHSFIPRWKPPFISELTPDNRCHLNGMAMKEGKPAYVTTFNQKDYRDSWYDDPVFEGTLIDVQTNEILLENLTMPHSPRFYNGRVYLCESGTGSILEYDPKTRTRRTLMTLPGFTRGINFYGPLMFVGLSKVRVSMLKNPIPIAKELEHTQSGIWIFNMETLEEVGHISFTGEIDQIYDIAILQETTWPELIEFEHPRTRHLFDYPKLPSQGELHVF